MSQEVVASFAGAGSVARWLSAKVRPAGRVVATDINPRFLGEVNLPNLEVRRHDITAEEDYDENRPASLTALRAARLFLSRSEEQHPTNQALMAHLLRLDPVMPCTSRRVQAFCRMLRERRGHEFDAWITAVQQNGVKELRAFARALLKDEAAVRAGLALIWSHEPTEGYVHRLKLIKRQAYGRAGVDFWRHRILPSSAGMAA